MLPRWDNQLKGEDLREFGAELRLAKLGTHRVRLRLTSCVHALQLRVAGSIPAFVAVVRARLAKDSWHGAGSVLESRRSRLDGGYRVRLQIQKPPTLVGEVDWKELGARSAATVYG